MSQLSSAPRVPIDHLTRLDLVDVQLDQHGPQYVRDLLVLVQPDHVLLVDGFAHTRVNLTCTPNGYGRQPWFTCPRCGARARILATESPQRGGWACQNCHRATWPSRTRGKTQAYRLLERHARALDQAQLARRRHPRSTKVHARLQLARERYEQATREYLAWAQEQIDTLAQQLGPRRITRES